MKRCVTRNVKVIYIRSLTFGGKGFILEVKEREDIEITEVTLENRDELPALILQKISEITQRSRSS